MNIGELIQAVQDILQTKDAHAADMLTHQAAAISDMVGWATGPIDIHGRLGERFAELQSGLRAHYAAKAEDGIAALHDALGELRDAIARHDSDIAGASQGDESDDV